MGTERLRGEVTTPMLQRDSYFGSGLSLPRTPEGYFPYGIFDSKNYAPIAQAPDIARGLVAKLEDWNQPHFPENVMKILIGTEQQFGLEPLIMTALDHPSEYASEVFNITNSFLDSQLDKIRKLPLNRQAAIGNTMMGYVSENLATLVYMRAAFDNNQIGIEGASYLIKSNGELHTRHAMDFDRINPLEKLEYVATSFDVIRSLKFANETYYYPLKTLRSFGQSQQQAVELIGPVIFLSSQRQVQYLQTIEQAVKKACEMTWDTTQVQDAVRIIGDMDRFSTIGAIAMGIFSNIDGISGFTEHTKFSPKGIVQLLGVNKKNVENSVSPESVQQITNPYSPFVVEVLMDRLAEHLPPEEFAEVLIDVHNRAVADPTRLHPWTIIIAQLKQSYPQHHGVINAAINKFKKGAKQRVLDDKDPGSIWLNNKGRVIVLSPGQEISDGYLIYVSRAANETNCKDNPNRKKEPAKPIIEVPGFGSIPLAQEPSKSASVLTTMYALPKPVADVAELERKWIKLQAQPVKPRETTNNLDNVKTELDVQRAKDRGVEGVQTKPRNDGTIECNFIVTQGKPNEKIVIQGILDTDGILTIPEIENLDPTARDTMQFTLNNLVLNILTKEQE